MISSALYCLIRSAPVPRCDDTIRIKLKNGVIDHRLNQMPEASLAFEQLELLLPSFGHVAGDFSEADKFAVMCANGVDNGQRPELRAILAKPPAFAFEAPRPRSRCQRLFGKLSLPIFQGKKTARTAAR